MTCYLVHPHISDTHNYFWSDLWINKDYPDHVLAESAISIFSNIIGIKVIIKDKRSDFGALGFLRSSNNEVKANWYLIIQANNI